MKIRQGFVSNSSSSSFICNINTYKKTNFTEKEIEEKLAKIFKMYADVMDSSIDALKNDVNVSTINGADYKKERRFYIEGHLLNDIKDNIDYVIVEESDDNGIPGMLFDLFEEAFNATRIHMG